MKVIQYSYPVTFTKEQVQLFANIFIRTFVTYIKLNKQPNLKKDSLFVYPLNMWRIIKGRKILLVAKDKIGETLLDRLDKQLLNQFEVGKLKIQRNEFEK